LVKAFFSAFENLQRHRATEHLWPIHRLPSVVLGKEELGIMNDNYFSMMWFSFHAHSLIDEASMTSSKSCISKNETFLHFLQCCGEGVIEVFKELCQRYQILFATQGNETIYVKYE